MGKLFSGVGARISAALAQKKQKQVWLCKQTGLSGNAVSQYVTEKRLPETAAIFLISRTLEVTIEWLLTGEENTTNEKEEIITTHEKSLLSVYRSLGDAQQAAVQDFMLYQFQKGQQTQPDFGQNEADGTA